MSPFEIWVHARSNNITTLCFVDWATMKGYSVPRGI